MCRMQFDDKLKWSYDFKDGGKLHVGDRVGNFFAYLYWELCGMR